MNHGRQPLSPSERYANGLRALEKELAELDDLGAHKAAAHLDAAIQQLRRDFSVLKRATAAHLPPESEARPPVEEAAILEPVSATFSEVSSSSQVFPRKANPANSR